MGMIQSIGSRLSRALRLQRKTETLVTLDELFSEWANTYGATKSGVVVTHETAMQTAVVLACVRLISEGIAQVPFRVMQESSGLKKPATNHPLHDLLTVAPNDWQTSFEFRETLALHTVLTGRGVAYIVRGAGGKVMELLPLDPTSVVPRRDGWDLRYNIVFPDGATTEVGADSVWHWRGPSWDSWRGLDATRLLREAIGLGIAAEEMSAKLFSNGGRLSGVLSTPAVMSPDMLIKLREDWQRNYGGSSNSGKTAILHGDWKWQSLSMSAADTQLQQARDAQIEEICRGFRVNPVMIGYSDKAATYASVEQMMLAHIKHTLAPWHARIEQSADKQLLSKGERAAGLYTKFFTQGLLRGAMADRTAYYTAMFNVGALSPNEIRELEDMNPYDDGDTYRIPLNMADPGAPPPTEMPKENGPAGVSAPQEGAAQSKKSGGVSAQFAEAGTKLANRRAGPYSFWADEMSEAWYAEEASRASQRGRTLHGVPGMLTITAAFHEPVYVPLRVLRGLKGEHAEQERPRAESLETLVRSMGDSGLLPLSADGSEQLPLVRVAHNGEAWIRSGNHRIMAADALGWESMPVEIRYYDGGERADGPLAPAVVAEFKSRQRKYRPDQARDDRGRWVDEGGAAMVSPNVEENLTIDEAIGAIGSERHRKLADAFAEIDRMLGLSARELEAIGAWADGAEDSTVSIYNRASASDIAIAASMKGLIADQKAVLAFSSNVRGPHVLYTVRSAGTDAKAISASLIAAGIQFHTLAKNGASFDVMVFDDTGDLADNVSSWSVNNGKHAEARSGTGRFIGSWDSRDDGARAYREEIERGLARPGADQVRRRAGWDRIRDRWGKAAAEERQRQVDVFDGWFANLLTRISLATKDAAFEAAHPRAPSGSPEGGQFIEKADGQNELRKAYHGTLNSYLGSIVENGIDEQYAPRRNFPQSYETPDRERSVFVAEDEYNATTWALYAADAAVDLLVEPIREQYNREHLRLDRAIQGEKDLAKLAVLMDKSDRLDRDFRAKKEHIRRCVYPVVIEAEIPLSVYKAAQRDAYSPARQFMLDKVPPEWITRVAAVDPKTQTSSDIFQRKAAQMEYKSTTQGDDDDVFVTVYIPNVVIDDEALSAQMDDHDDAMNYLLSSIKKIVEEKYDPDQPRAPAGAPAGEGGQWVRFTTSLDMLERSNDRSTIDLMNVDDETARRALKLDPKKNSVREVGEALERDLLARYDKIADDDYSDEAKDRVAAAIAAEVEYALAHEHELESGKGWYSADYPQAVEALANKYPELKTDPSARVAFDMLVAVCSNGEDVVPNIARAQSIYEQWRVGVDLKTLNIETRRGDLTENLGQIAALESRFGSLAAARGYLMEGVRVDQINKELRAAGLKADNSYPKDMVVPRAALFFGPKLGAFFANLSGAEDYLTMDLWWSRSVNRMRGTLTTRATDKAVSEFAEMIGQPALGRDATLALTKPFRDSYAARNYYSELETLMRAKEPKTDAAAGRYFEVARQTFGDRYDALLNQHRIEKRANTLYKTEFELLNDQPFRGSDRRFQFEATQRARQILASKGHNLSTADVQAAEWYYEKRLYQKLTGRDVNAIGYAEAIRRL
jgi:HK97 family phage portal protein